LLRWRHPGRGLIGPADFIPQAEDAGLIGPLGAWLLESACRQAQAWRVLRPLGPPLLICINVSARQFDQPDLVAQVGHALHETGLSPATLQIEVRESALLLNPEAARYTLAALRQIGVRLAIDGFGVGYSSIGFLQRFAVDALNVDRTVIGLLPNDASATAIVRAAVATAQALGIEVTAGGIELAEQLMLLRELGCLAGYGLLLGAPLPAPAVEELLQPDFRIELTGAA